MHIVFLELGPEIAKEFYGDIQKLVNNWLLVEGHSIGIGDCIADHETYQEIQATIKKSKVDLLSSVSKGSSPNYRIAFMRIDTNSIVYMKGVIRFNSYSRTRDKNCIRIVRFLYEL